MKDKRYLEIIIPAILVIGFASLVIAQTFKNQKVAINQNKESVQNEEKENLILKVVKENSQIIIQIEPTSPINLRAFAIRLTIKTNKEMPKITSDDISIQNIPNQAAWSIPIKKIETDKEKITVSLSGFIIGNPLDIKTTTPLAIINLPQDTQENFTIESILIDNEVTRFLDNSAETISYQSVYR